MRIDEYGEDSIYFVNQYERCFDKYNGENILFLDEFRGQLKYEMLLTLLSGYKSQIYARYTNVTGLWTEVHITSVFPPDLLYENMILNRREVDSYEQLRRRINFVIYHYCNESGEYCLTETPMKNYISHKKQRGIEELKPESLMQHITTEENPFLKTAV